MDTDGKWYHSTLQEPLWLIVTTVKTSPQSRYKNKHICTQYNIPERGCCAFEALLVDIIDGKGKFAIVLHV